MTRALPDRQGPAAREGAWDAAPHRTPYPAPLLRSLRVPGAPPGGRPARRQGAPLRQRPHLQSQNAGGCGLGGWGVTQRNLPPCGAREGGEREDMGALFPFPGRDMINRFLLI